MQCCAIFAVPYTCGQQANAMLCYLQCHTHMASRPMQCCATCSAIHIWPMQCCAILQCHTHHGLWANALLYVLLCSAAAVQCYTPTASRPMQWCTKLGDAIQMGIDVHKNIWVWERKRVGGWGGRGSRSDRTGWLRPDMTVLWKVLCRGIAAWQGVLWGCSHYYRGGDNCGERVGIGSGLVECLQGEKREKVGNAIMSTWYVWDSNVEVARRCCKIECPC